MLFLSPRLHEQVVLPGLGVTIRVLAIEGDVARLGVEGPAEVPALRAELLGRLLQALAGTAERSGSPCAPKPSLPEGREGEN